MEHQNLIIRRAQAEDLVDIVFLLFQDVLGSQRECIIDNSHALAHSHSHLSTNKGSLPDSYLKAFERIEKDPNSMLMVALLDQKIIGTFQLTFITYLHYQGSTVAQIEAVMVAPPYRGQKIGEDMMN